ncbi:lytic transglycosylase domain-containing protein [Paracoccus saliphilus]|uniref:Lytic transglycosylase domain-containing protein n=1 Tax=Paracoccus saliphilus TaxID=405559 RepID=A0AA45W890_9RHOB|nr:lytic transglycosylase domain-containing protein [Paracoccus saliphilus]WCR05528.1 lytic transglycosylase domain-containing protein [Paracoccus saliphilus]SIT15024.1 Transglycosylase SLT domain-containing protein [Paracoccus saliphilus]
MTNLRVRFGSGSCGAHRRILILLLSGLTFATAPPPVLAQSVGPTRAVGAHSYDAYIAEASQRFGIPQAWIAAVMRVESAGDVTALSSAGAMGLMQVMPETWAGLRIRYGLGEDPFDPRDNILAGTAYLREMWDRYRDVVAMLAAYNAGPARYDEYRSTDRPLPSETRAYVASLAPVLRGERPSGSVIATAKPRDWREAPLFVAHENGVSDAAPGSPGNQSDSTDASLSTAPESPAASLTDVLFVARNAGGDRP